MSVIQTIRRALVKKDLSVRDIVRGVLHDLAHRNVGNAVIEAYSESAYRRADQLDHDISSGADLPMGLGVPIAIKDNMCLEGELVTCASAMLSGYRSPYTATSIEYLMAQGFIPVGRTNMDEFAMGSSNEHSVYGPVDNPWNADHVSGGSSGGSAAVVAQGAVPVSLGSDTGGSIRQPASFCGVVGLKPTYGRVSRYGLVAFASSLDQIGPFSQCVDDTAILLDAICGFDPKDSTSNHHDGTVFFDDTPMDNLTGRVIGVPNELMGPDVDDDVRTGVMTALKKMESLGATVSFFDFPYFDASLAAYYILAPAEASSNLSRFDGVRYGHRTPADSLKSMIHSSRQTGFGDEVTRRIILGTHVLSSGYYDAYYGNAQRVRAVVTEQYATLFKTYDIICSPTATTTAFKKNAHQNNPLAMYLSDMATIPVNLAGLPAMSIPCGLDRNGLPIGCQFIAPWFKEKPMIQVARVLETALAFKPKRAFQLEDIVS